MARTSINEKLVLSFVLIGTFAIVLVTSVTFYYQKRALLDRTFDQLTSLRYVKKKIVEEYFNNRLTEIEMITASSEFRQATKSIVFCSEQKETNSKQHFPKVLENYMIANKKYMGCDFISEIKKAEKLGIQVNKLATSPFIMDFQSEKDTLLSHVVICKTLFEEEEFIGVFIFHLSSDAINKLVYEGNSQIGLGNSGETYLVGSDYFMRSNSRFSENSYLKIQVKTEGVFTALKEKEGTAIFDDYRGIEVLSSFTTLDIPGLNWVLLAEIDYKEAMIPIDNSRSTIMFIGIILMTITFLVAFLTAKTISAPIIKLKNASINVGKGNFNLQLKRSSNDEIGELTDTFNAMITRLKSQTDELHEREERLKHFYEATNDGILLHNNHKLLLSNQAISILSGYPETELYDKEIVELIYNYQEISKNKSREAASAHETLLFKKDGTKLQIEIQESKIDYKGQTISATVIRDISKRKRVENDLKLERWKRLRAVIDGQDSERQRLSRELHDGLGQKLIATKLKLEIAREKKISESKDIIRDIGEEFDRTIDEVRRISNNLMPAALEEFGISAALRFLSEEMGENKSLDVSYESSGEFALLGSRAKTYLFRITQEALNNIVKHANAKNIKVALKQQDFQVVLNIEDDGMGFDPKNIQSHVSSGLHNMRERVNLLQGSLEIFSQAGKGTAIKVTIPFDNL